MLKNTLENLPENHSIGDEGRNALLYVDDVTHTYGSDHKAYTAIRGLSFEISAGDFVSIVGPSGAGKTTMLKILSGLLSPSEGSVYFKGNPITGVPEGLALVFQDYSSSLLPWHTVEKNISFPLNKDTRPKEAIRTAVRESLQAVGLSEEVGSKYPWQLSGGMQQRVAIARALAYRPSLLLMDEPFASVDAQTRAELEDLIISLQKYYDMTVLLVTHDIDESVYVANRVLVLSSAPAHLAADIPVRLPEEREQLTTKELPEFLNARRKIAELIVNK